MRWKTQKRQREMLSLIHDREMRCKCKLSVRCGCSGSRRSEGGCLRGTVVDAGITTEAGELS